MIRIAIAALSFLLVSCGNQSDTTNGQSETDIDTWKYMAEQDVKQRLRDPDSAVFGNVQVRKNGEITAVCGTVNSRNGFGGMSGPTRFVWGNTVVHIEGDGQVAPETFAALWANLC